MLQTKTGTLALLIKSTFIKESIFDLMWKLRVETCYSG